MTRWPGRAKHVLQVVTDDDRRGGQIFAHDLEPALRRLGHDVRTVGLEAGSVGGLEFAILGQSRLGTRTLVALRREIAEADVVVAHGSTTLPACALAGAGTGVPFVYRQISDSSYWADSALRRARVRMGLRRAARVVALWRGAADTLTTLFGVPSDRIDVIPNGVGEERFPVATADARARSRARLNLPNTTAVVSYVGALVSEKGVKHAIDALASIDRVALLVAGDGPTRKHLERQAAVSGEDVRFLGSVDRPFDVYAAADVVVLPSLGGDSMPATLIEAGMMGIPAVSTTVAAIPEIVIDGATGFVVSPGDRAAFTQALRCLVDNADLRRRFGSAARSHCVEHYSMETVARQWSDTLEYAVASAAGCARRPVRV